MLENIKYLVVKLFVKMATLLLILRTKLMQLGENDPTKILLENFTPIQINKQKESYFSSKESEKFSAKILIIIPFRDQWTKTFKCLNSLANQNLAPHFATVVLADNQSQNPETKSGINSFVKERSTESLIFKEHIADYPFNYSKINNEVFFRFHLDIKPDYLLCLNNDVELTSNTFIFDLLNFASKLPGLGALGTTLLYPDQRIQHLFLAPGVKLVGAHPFKGKKHHPQWSWFDRPRPVAAVTGALLLTKANNYLQVGGFDECLPTLGQDLDLCLKFQRVGLTNWVAPRLMAIHHEGASRGGDIDPAQVAYMYRKWGDFLIANDYYSTNISRWSELPALSWCEGRYPWELLMKKK